MILTPSGAAALRQAMPFFSLEALSAATGFGVPRLGAISSGRTYKSAFFPPEEPFSTVLRVPVTTPLKTLVAGQHRVLAMHVYALREFLNARPNTDPALYVSEFATRTGLPISLAAALIESPALHALPPPEMHTHDGYTYTTNVGFARHALPLWRHGMPVPTKAHMRRWAAEACIRVLKAHDPSYVPSAALLAAMTAIQPA